MKAQLYNQSLFNNCKCKKIKSPTSSQSRRACNCEKKKLKNSSLRNHSRCSERSNSQSRNTARSHNQHQNLLHQQFSLDNNQQYLSQQSPRSLHEMGISNTLTNLKINGCEFPSLMTTRNPQIGSIFSSDTSNLNHHLLQQPTLNTMSFNTLNPSQFRTSLPNGNTLGGGPSHLYQSPMLNLSPSQKVYDQISQFRSFSPTKQDNNQRNLAGTALTPSKQIISHYDRVLSEFEIYSQQRAIQLREGLSKIIDGLRTDDIISAMREDPLSHNFAYLRMKEIADNAILCESEQVIANLRTENVFLREKILILEAESQKKVNSTEIERLEKKLKHAMARKVNYKNQLKESQEQIGQLLNKYKELEFQLQKQQSEFDLKLAQKDGELSRCERALSEVRATLSEKTIAQNKLENNLSNEVTVLSDRIVSLEKERNEMIDKCNEYGHEFKYAIDQEQTKWEARVLKKKQKIKDLKMSHESLSKTLQEMKQQTTLTSKELEGHKVKLSETIQQLQEKQLLLKDQEDKNIHLQKDFNSRLKEQKQKYKSKMTQLQIRFEQALQEKLHLFETETRDKLLLFENEKRELEQKLTQLQSNHEYIVEEDKQGRVVLQKQAEKKIEKLQVKYEQEIMAKLAEVEETFRELEQKLRKEHKQERKQWAAKREEEVEEQQTQVQQMQERYETEFREMSLKLREEVDCQQKAGQEARIKIAELNILVETHRVEAERLQRECEKLIYQQREMTESNKREVQMYEEKLRIKIEENDEKVRHALDQAIKQSNLESIAKQYAAELDKKQSEIQCLKDQLTRLNTKFDKNLDDAKIVQLELQASKQLTYDKEFRLSRVQTLFKETMSKIFQQVRIQGSKYKQELEYLKRHYHSELEMSKKSIESQVLAIISKAREISYTQRFKLEKLQYHYESKFQKEFNQREAEWEKIWEKREDTIAQKERSLKELEFERVNLREQIIRLENEVNQLKTQNYSQKKDFTQRYEEVKAKLNSQEQKHNELSLSYKNKEDLLVNQQKQQLNDLRVLMQQKSQEELKKLELQMAEYRDKNKTKVQTMAEHIQEAQQKHRQELLNIKTVYEGRIKELETDNDLKQRSLFESSNKFNLLEVKFEQFVKENESLEFQLKELAQKEKDLQGQVALLKQQSDALSSEKDALAKQKEQLEKEVHEFDFQNRTLQTQIYTAERKLVQQKNELKKKMRKLHLSKQRELEEVQFLSEILTRNPTSAQKQRKSQVNSPDFKRSCSQTQGFSTYRGGERQGVALSNSQSNYGNILSEINNMIDNRQLRLSNSNAKSTAFGKSQRFSGVICSPSVGQLNPSTTFYHKSILKSPSSQVNDENAQMKISDLKQY